MGLFSNLLETYEKCTSVVGIVPTDKNGEPDERKAFLPLFHMTFKSQVCVTIDAAGNLIGISRDKKDQTIAIPCTEKSASRARGIAAHPLCDQLAYVDKTLSEDKFEAYQAELGSWKGDNVKLNAIYTYLSDHSVVDAMQSAESDLFKESEYQEKDGDKVLIAEKIAKIGIRFSVQVPGDYTPNVWEDQALRELWIVKQLAVRDGVSGFDYLSGESVTQVAATHPKNINSMTGNAKLISCNDNTGFTFRGRFASQDEAVQIDTSTSLKTHNTLKWLISNYGIHTDSQAIVIWAVDDDTNERIKPFGNSYDIFGELESVNTDQEELSDAATEVDANYSYKVAKALRGYASANELKEHGKKIVIAIFDAATTGRMGVTFYQEFPENEYLENIAKWHEDSAWHLVTFVKEKTTDQKGKETEVAKLVRYVGCPSFKDILEAVYGKPRSGNDTGYSILKRKVQKQLIECMFGNFAFPKSFVTMAAVRASNPMSFDIENYGQDSNDWRRTLHTACALARKYYIHNELKEAISMELEENRQDRDYLYGRLLAVADRLESTALYKANKIDSQKRATNAVKLMSGFVNKPFTTWGILSKQLFPYKMQLQGAGYYQNIIDSIMALFKQGDYEDNRPLSPLYLLGYSAQNRALSKKNKENQEETNNGDAE